jgi:hypothetical protein
VGEAGRPGLAGDGFEEARDGHGPCFGARRALRPD